MAPAWPRRLRKINRIGFHYIAKTGFPLPKNQQICRKWRGKSSNFSTNCATKVKFYVWYLRSQRVWVCTKGIYFVFSNSGRSWIWDQIDSVREIRAQQYFPLKGVVKYLVPMGQSCSYTIARKDGLQVTVDTNEVNRIERFGELLKHQAAAFQFGWAVVEK